MKFTVVTPSFGQLHYLKLNAASIADQRAPGIDVEHIVQDGGSKDGTREWLATRPDIRGVAEADNGMYDAINRGIMKGEGDIFSWLNCDEQFLPGALAAVKTFFEEHPEADMLAGDTLVVDAKGRIQVPPQGCGAHHRHPAARAHTGAELFLVLPGQVGEGSGCDPFRSPMEGHGRLGLAARPEMLAVPACSVCHASSPPSWMMVATWV
jgi:glycosyltransferase involved in cell wall biosynthesis